MDTPLESHASLDPTMKAYLDRPKDHVRQHSEESATRRRSTRVPAPQGQTPQRASWTIVSGTGEYEGLSGSGKSEAVYGPNPQFAGSLHVYWNRHAIDTAARTEGDRERRPRY